jgi:hypothetical protein
MEIFISILNPNEKNIKIKIYLFIITGNRFLISALKNCLRIDELQLNQQSFSPSMKLRNIITELEKRIIINDNYPPTPTRMARQWYRF